ncbi:hypothetical protein TNIN_335591 [Trichonephila inaurata madagascariensis]|uniref:Uncharacterized protein n=1 Tax=Trichonephila inaurata madagascariensis TaxID=2747483 RepID=A0A8X7BQ02_9ARAC|nr:hypothetical protein TNIN_335591 [Trichonephila inaurata madagascariensis]
MESSESVGSKKQTRKLPIFPEANEYTTLFVLSPDPPGAMRCRFVCKRQGVTFPPTLTARLFLNAHWILFYFYYSIVMVSSLDSENGPSTSFPSVEKIIKTVILYRQMLRTSPLILLYCLVLYCIG